MAKLVKSRISPQSFTMEGLLSRRMNKLIESLDARPEQAYAAMAGLITAGSRAVPYLSASLPGASQSASLRMIFALAEAKDTRAIEALTLVASKSDKQVLRKHAPDALRKIYAHHDLLAPELLNGVGQDKKEISRPSK